MPQQPPGPGLVHEAPLDSESSGRIGIVEAVDACRLELSLVVGDLDVDRVSFFARST